MCDKLPRSTLLYESFEIIKKIYIRSIPAQIDLAVSLTIIVSLSHVTCWRASQKYTAHEVVVFSKNCSGSITPKITQRTENDAVARYRFGYNLYSKFYVKKKQIFWAIGKNGHVFSLKFMRKSI